MSDILQTVRLPFAGLPVGARPSPSRVVLDQPSGTPDEVTRQLLAINAEAPVLELVVDVGSNLVELPTLDGLEQLTSLVVRDPSLSAARISGPLRSIDIQCDWLWLQGCTKLRELRGQTQFLRIQRAGVELGQVANLRGLISLELLGGYKSPELVALSGCDSLRFLTLTAIRGLRETDLDKVGRLPELELVYLPVTDRKLAVFGRCFRGLVSNGGSATRSGKLVPDGAREFWIAQRKWDQLHAKLLRGERAAKLECD